MKNFHRIVLLIVLSGLFVQSAVALTHQVVFFNGFNPDENSGMDILNTELAVSGIPDYLGRVFEYNERQEAFDWIQQTGNRSTLVLIGHSFGGNATLQLANNYLKPAGVTVDLTIQIDSIANFGSGANDELPTNVDVGINYYQPSGFDLHGESDVQGATNIDVEELFTDTSITHTSIDNDERLHALIGQNILDNLNQPSADFDHDGDIDGADFLVWQRDPNVGSLSDWQINYGSVPLSVTSVAVPEPSAILLLLVAANSTILSRRHTCLREVRG